MQDPHYRAFRRAQALARDSWLTIAPLEFTDERNHHLAEITKILADGDNPQKAILAVVGADDQTDVSDHLVDVAVTATEAGYLYGFALGLTFAKGGGR